MPRQSLSSLVRRICFDVHLLMDEWSEVCHWWDAYMGEFLRLHMLSAVVVFPYYHILFRHNYWVSVPWSLMFLPMVLSRGMVVPVLLGAAIVLPMGAVVRLSHLSWSLLTRCGKREPSPGPPSWLVTFLK